MQGFINVFKPSKMSSAKVVAKIKHAFKLDKVGHFGTLDPLACGILPIAIGKATRMFDYFLDKQKTYIARFKFGASSNTFDLDGVVEFNTGSVPTKSQIENILPSFIGTISQLPPQFSAKVVNGQKAYKLARKGESISLSPKDVTIFNFKLTRQVDIDSFEFEITCSSGTYIRSLACDVALKLNTTALMSYLERTESGVFNKQNCVMLDDLLKGNVKDYVIDYQKVFPHFLTQSVKDSDFIKLKNGLSIETNLTDSTNIFIINNNVTLGVAQAKNNQLKLKTYLLD